MTAERGFIAFRVEGTLDFGLIGVLARLSTALAEANVSLFAVSTYETDYLFVREADEEKAVAALSSVATMRSGGHERPHE